MKTAAQIRTRYEARYRFLCDSIRRRDEANAYRYIDEARDTTDESFYVGTDLVVRWRSVNRCVPADLCDAFFVLGGISYEEWAATAQARAEETAAFLEKYREAQKGREVSDEERFEMRAAFGEGAEVVNVITGRRTRL